MKKKTKKKKNVSKFLTRLSAGAAIGLTTYFLLKGDKKDKLVVNTKPPMEDAKQDLFI